MSELWQNTVNKMQNFGNKLFIFLFGVMFGLLLGGGAVFYYQSNQMKENMKGNDEGKSLSLINKFIDFAEKKMSLVKGNKEKEDSLKISEKIKLKIAKDSLENMEALQDSTTEDENQAQTEEINKENNTNDSLAAIADKEKTDSLNEITNSGEELIILRTNEILFSKIIDLIDADYIPQTKQDSLIMSEMIPRKVLAQISVEFWKSPINFKGFKLGKNKLVLFGVYEYDSVKLIRLNNTVFMKYLSSFYKLMNTDNFLPLTKVTDDILLLKLNQW